MHLPVHGQDGEQPGGAAGLAGVAVAPLRVSVRHKQRVSPALAVLKGAVLIVREVILGADVPGSASEAEKARPTVASWREQGATDAQ